MLTNIAYKEVNSRHTAVQNQAVPQRIHRAIDEGAVACQAHLHILLRSSHTTYPPPRAFFVTLAKGLMVMERGIGYDFPSHAALRTGAPALEWQKLDTGRSILTSHCFHSNKTKAPEVSCSKIQIIATRPVQEQLGIYPAVSWKTRC
jgi:hypothetical protein